MRSFFSRPARPAVVAISLLLSLAGIVLPLMHGFGFMAGFNTQPLAAVMDVTTPVEPRPPSIPPALPGRRRGAASEASGGTPDGGRLVFVLIDGLRADHIAAFGTSTWPRPKATCELTTVLPSFSRPSYVALSTGAPPSLSGVHTNDHKGPAHLDSIWDIARRAGFPTRLAADGTDWWVDLFPRAFAATTVVAKEDFAAAFDPRPLARGELMLLHIVDGDDQAHDFGVGPEYQQALERAAALVSRVVATLDPARDTLILTADHGHIARGGHGGPEPEVMHVPLVAFGRGIVDGATCQGRLPDLASTLAALLVLPAPVASTGRPLAILSQSDKPAEPSAIAPATRTTSLVGLLVAAALVLALLFAIAKAGGSWRLAVAGLVWPALAVLTYALLEPTLSLSAVWLEDPWTLRMIAVLGIPALVSAGFVTFVLAPREIPWARLMVMAVGALLPLAAARGAHGSFSAGPELGPPEAAFGLLVGDLMAALGIAAALLVTLASLWRKRPAGDSVRPERTHEL